MKKKAMIRYWLAIILSVFVLPSLAIAATPQSKGVLVGRVSHVEGELLRYVPETDDWVAVVADAPFGLDDALYSGEDGKAEFILPNRTRIRIGGTTQIQLITLNGDLTQVDVASGTARFFNNSDSVVMKITTPLGDVVAYGGTSFDIYVGEESIEVVSLEGVVDFVIKEGEKYEVEAGSSILSNGSTVTEGEGTVEMEWQAWNEKRDSFWAQKTQVKGDSVKYLPDGLKDESYALDETGRWERVQYRGETRELWRPNNVDAEWEPFTSGRWATYHGDSTWIPQDEPFGYVTHHYGNWVYLDGPRAWYWAPPVVVAAVARPAFGVSFSWYPGRVGWIHSAARLGWFPLAPFEPYYAHRSWGPRTVIVRDVRRINININRFTHVRRAVIINRNDFFGARNFRNVRIRNINRTTIVKNFRAAPVLNNRVIPNFSNNRRRFQFANTAVNRVPHQVVEDRIRRNRQIARRTANLRGATVEQNIRKLRAGNVARDVSIQRPRVSNRLVAREEARKERRQVQFQQRELRRQAGQLDRVEERRQRARELRQQRRAAQPPAGQGLTNQERRERARERVRTQPGPKDRLREQRRERRQDTQQLRQERQQRRQKDDQLRRERRESSRAVRQQREQRQQQLRQERQQRSRQLRQQQRPQRLEQQQRQRDGQLRQERRERVQSMRQRKEPRQQQLRQERQQRARELRRQQRPQRLEQQQRQREGQLRRQERRERVQSMRQQREPRQQQLRQERQQRARELRQQRQQS